jgi:uncharacterized membrane protein
MAVLETVHIACAIVWLGNFVVTGVWSLRAFAARNASLRLFASREMLFTDAVFTLAFGAAVTVSGIALANAEGLAIWQTFWTRTAIETVAGALVAWAVVLLPLELRIRALAQRNSPHATNAFALWNVCGWTITLALFCIIYLMVARPL